MFDYDLPGGLPAGSRTVWSQTPLQPLVAGALTPFSYSVLDEIAGRAWYQYYDLLGFAPMPRARVVRQIQGRAYLNLTLSAQREAEHAALEPLTLRINGEEFPVAKWEKPGLLAGLKAGFQQKKIDDAFKKFAADMEAVTQKAQSWCLKINGLRWTQAEILQVMEEIEHAGIPSFMRFLAAQHNLDRVTNQLARLLVEQGDNGTNLAWLEGSSGAVDQPIAHEIQTSLTQIGTQAASDPATLAWLATADLTDWQARLPNPALVASLVQFLQRYGHRASAEGEIRTPRWGQDPTPLFAQLPAAGRQPSTAAAAERVGENSQNVLAVAGGRRKEAEQLLQKRRSFLDLRSRALHAFAYVLAATRIWALAAAREAMLDQRLQAPDDVFFFALEEMKEMMTGEWNISAQAEIHATCARRKTEFAGWQTVTAPELLIGEAEAISR
ncbi:MAG: hypothetical protein M3Q45_03760 [Chloroflexota bacterium]|nr:hypothetical protein [Chloroflexota bacterium]